MNKNEDNTKDYSAFPELEPQEADLEFIAHAREDVPALLAEVKRLQGCLSEHEIAADRLYAICAGALDGTMSKGELRGRMEIAIGRAKPEEYFDSVGSWVGRADKGCGPKQTECPVHGDALRRGRCPQCEAMRELGANEDDPDPMNMGDW